MKRNTITWIAAALMVAPLLAWADPKTPDDWYKEGENQYNLGNFDKAVDAFKKGFELEPNDSKKAAYLFNIAQAYRQAKNCKDAQFFYKRYLALKDADTKKPLPPDTRKEIEGRIAELDDCAQKQEAIRNKPPDRNPDIDKPDTKPDGTKPDGTKRVADVKPDETIHKDENPTPTVFTPPKLISLRLVAGGAKVSTGSLDVPVQATGALIGGYPLAINPKLTIELGGAFTFTPVPFEDMMGASKTANLIGVLANAGATYQAASKISVRGELGAGVLVFSGVSESPFTNFAATSGALSMLHVRIGVSGDFAITNNIVATLTPFAFSYSPAKTGLRSDISSITAIDFMVGLGYRM